MVPSKGVLAVLLLAVYVNLTLAVPADGKSLREQEESVVEQLDLKDTAVKSKGRPQGRFLEPAFFGVKKKKFTIGQYGVGTFFRAWRNCIDEGKSLATIESEQDQHKIDAMIAGTETDYWIGATNLGAPDYTLTWLTTDLAVEMAPSDLALDDTACISLGPSGEWKPNACFDSEIVFPYICEAHY
uniref:C-type lectin domain-containing protein n=1 Tax=Anopheles farauti TaxID=69004 RepID=A0A182QLT8_9DIPT